VIYRAPQQFNAKMQDMNTSGIHNQRFSNMTFASVYPMYLTKVEKKGRTKEELHQVIQWLTGFDNKKLQELIKEKVTFETFFQLCETCSFAALFFRLRRNENDLSFK
jgi:Uncharacterized protein conserved in bacteria (DUF2200)